jgi:hypothetical protein
MHSVAVVAGPCDRVVATNLPLSDVDVPSDQRTTRDRTGDGTEQSKDGGRGGDRSGSGERRVDEVEREKIQALADPF